MIHEPLILIVISILTSVAHNNTYKERITFIGQYTKVFFTKKRIRCNWYVWSLLFKKSYLTKKTNILAVLIRDSGRSFDGLYVEMVVRWHCNKFCFRINRLDTSRMHVHVSWQETVSFHSVFIMKRILHYERPFLHLFKNVTGWKDWRGDEWCLSAWGLAVDTAKRKMRTKMEEWNGICNERHLRNEEQA